MSYCNHDPAALSVVEFSQCECGALVDADTGADQTERAARGFAYYMQGMGLIGKDVDIATIYRQYRS